MTRWHLAPARLPSRYRATCWWDIQASIAFTACHPYPYPPNPGHHCSASGGLTPDQGSHSQSHPHGPGRFATFSEIIWCPLNQECFTTRGSIIFPPKVAERPSCRLNGPGEGNRPRPESLTLKIHNTRKMESDKHRILSTPSQIQQLHGKKGFPTWRAFFVKVGCPALLKRSQRSGLGCSLLWKLSTGIFSIRLR